MAFDETKDKELWQGQINDLMVSVHSYNGGDPKLQIGPRVVTKKDGSESYRKAGRLTGQEMEWLVEMWGGEMGALMTGEPSEGKKHAKTK